MSTISSRQEKRSAIDILNLIAVKNLLIKLNQAIKNHDTAKFYIAMDKIINHPSLNTPKIIEILNNGLGEGENQVIKSLLQSPLSSINSSIEKSLRKNEKIKKEQLYILASIVDTTKNIMQKYGKEFNVKVDFEAIKQQLKESSKIFENVDSLMGEKLFLRQFIKRIFDEGMIDGADSIEKTVDIYISKLALKPGEFTKVTRYLRNIVEPVVKKETAEEVAVFLRPENFAKKIIRNKSIVKSKHIFRTVAILETIKEGVDEDNISQEGDVDILRKPSVIEDASESQVDDDIINVSRHASSMSSFANLESESQFDEDYVIKVERHGSFKGSFADTASISHISDDEVINITRHSSSANLNPISPIDPRNFNNSPPVVTNNSRCCWR